MIEVRRADSWIERRRFYRFSHELYRGDARWREPKAWGGRNVICAAKNEMLHCPHALFIAHEDGRPLARALTGVKEGRGYFALFDAREREDAVEALLNEVIGWQRRMGARTLEGPVAPTIADLGGGVLVEGFDRGAASGDIYNAPYYGMYLERFGFRGDSEWLSYRVSLRDFDGARYRAVSEWVERRFGISVRYGLQEGPRQLAGWIATVMNAEAGVENIRRILGRMNAELDRAMCPVAFEGDEPVGFLLTMRRGKEVPRIVTLWVREDRRRRGVTAVLFYALFCEMKRGGVEEADASLIRWDNFASKIGAERAGARLFRRYKQYKIDI